MTAPSYFTFDGYSPDAIVPYRPGIDDLGGAAWEDDQAYPPDPATMPYAAALNQQQTLLRALARVIPAVVLSVTVSGATATVYGLASMSDAIVPADFTLTVVSTTVQIRWAAGTLPVGSIRPHGLTVHETGAGDAYASPVTNGVDVVFATAAKNFTLCLSSD